jgi:hypothetical protein
MFQLYWRLKDLNMNHKYILDKVLHDQKFLEQSFLQSDAVKTIFLLREPQRTLASILDIKPHQNEQHALGYYTGRLATLESYARLINSKEKSLFITHDQVLNQSQLVFNILQSHLDTKTGFSEEYRVLKTTGSRGIGDSSENIKAGKIIKQARKLDIEISDSVLTQAQKAYDRCYETLSHYCHCI